MKQSLLLSLMSVALVFLLIGCSSQEEVYKKEIESLKISLIEDVLKENPEYSYDALESRWAVVQDVVPGRTSENNLKVKVIDQQSKDILILRNDKHNLSEKEGTQHCCCNA